MIAVIALIMGGLFRREVIAANDGTDNMKVIALAVQEGASAYLARQFRTLGVFAIIAFLLLLALPVHEGEFGTWTLKIARSIAFLVGAVFSGLIGYPGHVAGRQGQRAGRVRGTQPRGATQPCGSLSAPVRTSA